MADIAGQDRQTMMLGGRGNDEIRQSRRPADGAGVVGEASKGLGNARIERENPIWIEVEDKAEPSGEIVCHAGRPLSAGLGDAFGDFRDCHRGQEKQRRVLVHPIP